MMVALPIVLICSTIFMGIGIWAFKSKKPIHFWSGTTVKPEEIRDIKAYNKANGLMWIIYGSCYVISWFAGCIWGEAVFGMLTMLVALVGVGILIAVYRWIYNKYKVR